MVGLNQISRVFSKYIYSSNVNLTETYFTFFREVCQSICIKINPEFLYLKSLAPEKEWKAAEKESRKVMQLLKDEGVTYPLKEADRLAQGLLCEGLHSLRKSIFWFFNYRYNDRVGFIAPSIQAKYYSEFFSIIGLSRLLGIARTYVPIFGVIQTETSWKRNTIHFIPQSKTGGGHLKHLSELGRHLSKFDFISDETRTYFQKIWPRRSRDGTVRDVERQVKFLMTDDRETYVYGFEKRSRVYDRPHSTSPRICFIGGENGLAVPGPDESDDPGDFSDSIMMDYTSYGYEEHNIGIILQDLIKITKSINNDSIRKFMRTLIDTIESFDSVSHNAKVDILHWLK